jgi:hypothetical protein
MILFEHYAMNSTETNESLLGMLNRLAFGPLKSPAVFWQMPFFMVFDRLLQRPSKTLSDPLHIKLRNFAKKMVRSFFDRAKQNPYDMPRARSRVPPRAVRANGRLTPCGRLRVPAFCAGCCSLRCCFTGT